MQQILEHWVKVLFVLNLFRTFLGSWNYKLSVGFKVSLWDSHHLVSELVSNQVWMSYLFWLSKKKEKKNVKKKDYKKIQVFLLSSNWIWVIHFPWHSLHTYQLCFFPCLLSFLQFPFHSLCSLNFFSLLVCWIVIFGVPLGFFFFLDFVYLVQ